MENVRSLFEAKSLLERAHDPPEEKEKKWSDIVTNLGFNPEHCNLALEIGKGSITISDEDCDPHFTGWNHYLTFNNGLEHIFIDEEDHLQSLKGVLGFSVRYLARFFENALYIYCRDIEKEIYKENINSFRKGYQEDPEDIILSQLVTGENILMIALLFCDEAFQIFTLDISNSKIIFVQQVEKNYFLGLGSFGYYVNHNDKLRLISDTSPSEYVMPRGIEHVANPSIIYSYSGIDFLKLSDEILLYDLTSSKITHCFSLDTLGSDPFESLIPFHNEVIDHITGETVYKTDDETIVCITRRKNGGGYIIWTRNDDFKVEEKEFNILI